ncbi:AraC family transcriptional regulator [Arsenicibacter rosenii]|uniref:AraC family transcriptional regulator n=1 Tax=Arsenicibacter rosenii TaxID=1750698 RepID=A0A1S2VNB3_9BACT|nr:AraC family transcriptional regulator [Arsenicibacter rosenii]OIN60253.1 AraC family transcriptional regulator [Arsenicibacter rosenii]
MKLIREEVQPDQNSSFKLFTPRLNDFYYWHFHPEYELVYIEGADGPRHVGDHLSRYSGSDLVLIGPYIPHLNFDYGVRTGYRKVVVQMQPDFMGMAFAQTPELSDIARLLEQARQGIAFDGKTKQEAGQRLLRLHSVSHFRQLMELLAIFQLLATSAEAMLLHSRPVEQAYNQRQQDRIQQIYRFIDQHYQRRMEVSELADLTNLTPAAFCRYFRQMTRMTFTEYVNQYRVVQAKKGLLQGRSVTEACFESGFESLSYFNRVFRRVTGQNPLQFKKDMRR